MCVAPGAADMFVCVWDMAREESSSTRRVRVSTRKLTASKMVTWDVRLLRRKKKKRPLLCSKAILSSPPQRAFTPIPFGQFWSNQWHTGSQYLQVVCRNIQNINVSFVMLLSLYCSNTITVFLTKFLSNRWTTDSTVYYHSWIGRITNFGWLNTGPCEL